MKKIALYLILISVSPTAWSLPDGYPGLAPAAYHAIDFKQLKSQGHTLQLPILGAQFQIPKQLDKSSNGDISFEQNNEFGHLNVTLGENSIFGSWHHQGKDFRLTTDKSGAWLVELPTDHLIQDSCGTKHSTEKLTKQHELKTEKAASTTIDVLVVHDQPLALRYPGGLMQSRINHYMHVANQTFANSGLDLDVRLVGIEELPYNHNNSNGDMLSHMQSTLNNTGAISGLEDLPQLRADTGADLIIAIRPHDIETRGNCGLAYYPTSNFDASFGLNMVSDGMSSWSLCSDMVFVHEIGHNLGAAHQYGEGGGSYQAQGSAFIKLYQFNTVMGSFGTAQNNRGKRLPLFSNPSQTCGGYACGSNSGAEPSNNVAVINGSKNAVSNYVTNNSNAPFPIDYQRSDRDFDGDGVNDWNDHFPFDASETADADLDGHGDNKDVFPNNPAEYADNDMDGIGDRADTDDDNDGRSDLSDDFPFDANEQDDDDKDGVGNNSDAFPHDVTEQLDFDLDGIGDHADKDDDDDGVVDYIANILEYKLDLLVINEGDNRILRFDATNGRSLGIEVLPDDGLLTFQSDMAYDHETQHLYYTSSSGVKRKNMMQRDGSDMLIPAYLSNDNFKVALGTGFPTAIFKRPNLPLLVSKIDRGSLSLYNINNPNDVRSEGEWLLPAQDFPETIIDIEESLTFISLGLDGRLYKGYGNNGINRIDQGLYLPDAVDMALTLNGSILVADAQLKQIVQVNSITGEYEGVFANFRTMGLGVPTGLTLEPNQTLYVATQDNKIHRFDTETGEYFGVFIDGLGLNQPRKMMLVPRLQDRYHHDADKVIRPNAGQWFAQETAGRGFDIEVVGNRLNVIWYTFDSNGQPTWYISAGDLEGFHYYSSMGKTHQTDLDTVTLDDVGSLDMTFLNERQAQITWAVGELAGSELIEWHPFSGEPEVNNYTGLWGRQDGPGWGISLATVGETSVSIAFIYDEMGEPRWVISQPFVGQSPLAFDYLYVTSDTLCPSCSGVSAFNAVAAGNMLMSFGNNAYWDSDISFPQPVNGVWQIDGVPLTRFSSEPTRPR